MIDLESIEIRKLDLPKGATKWLVLLEDRVVMEIKPTRRRQRSSGIVADEWMTFLDVRGEPRVVQRVPMEEWKRANRDVLIEDMLGTLLCEVCLQEWGPVCNECLSDVGDDLFFLFKDLQRLQIEGV